MPLFRVGTIQVLLESQSQQFLITQISRRIEMLRLSWNRLNVWNAKQGLRVQGLARACFSSQIHKASPTTEVRASTAVDQPSLWTYLTSKGLRGFEDQQKCVMKQFAHGRVCYLTCCVMTFIKCCLMICQANQTRHSWLLLLVGRHTRSANNLLGNCCLVLMLWTENTKS